MSDTEQKAILRAKVEERAATTRAIVMMLRQRGYYQAADCVEASAAASKATEREIDAAMREQERNGKVPNPSAQPLGRVRLWGR